MDDSRNRDVFEEALREVVRPATFITGIAYIGIGIAHWLSLPGIAGPVVGGLELAASALLLTLAARSRNRQYDGVELNLRASVPVFAVLTCNAAFLYFNREPQPTFGLYIVAGALGVITYSNRWFAGLMSATLGLWIAVVVTSGAPLIEWSEHGIVMGAMVAVGAVANIWRRNYVAKIAGLKRDIEQQLRLRESADIRLAQVEKRFRRIADHANDIIVEIDYEGAIQYANPAATAVLGYGPDELLGKVGDGVVLEEEGAISMRELRVRLRSTANSESILALRHRDGSRRWLEVSAQRFRELPPSTQPDDSTNADPRSPEKLKRWRVVLVARDITQRMAIEQELEQHRTHLEELVIERTEALAASLRELQHRERLASIGTLTAGIAHQINNPVGSILASSEFALAVEGDADQLDVWRESLTDNAKQARRCGDIVRSMLQFARNEPTEKRIEDLGAIARNVSRQAQKELDAGGGNIAFERAAVDIPVLASAIELEQVLLNLIANATEAATGRAHIRVTVDRIGDVGRIFVADTGRGMEKDVVDRIFDPFFTTRLQSGGSGLGLSVAHGIVADHGGELDVKSAVGKGTTVTVEIPIASVADENVAERFRP